MVDDRQKRIQNLVIAIDDLDLSRALKFNLGEVSLKAEYESLLLQAFEKIESLNELATSVSRSQVIQVCGVGDTLKAFVQDLQGLDPTQFIQQREGIRAQLANLLDQLETALLPFNVARQQQKIESMFGSGEADVDQLRQNLQRETEKILFDVRREAEQILADATKQAGDIQNTARKTAKGVSVLQLQIRFADLISNFNRGLLISGIVAGVSFAVFVFYVVYLLHNPPELKFVPDAIYASAIRLTLLASIAAIISFSLKIFRSNLNMYYHTLHRQQLTNSISSFVDAARTDEHRDAVLIKLIDAVSTFGSSGLVSGGDDMPNTAKVIIDALPKALSAKPV